MSQLLVTHGLLPVDSCFSEGYLGTFGSESLYLPSIDCLSVVRLDPDVVNFVSVPEGTTTLYWISEVALEEDVAASLKPENPWENTDTSLSNGFAASGSNNPDLIYRSPTASIIALHGDAAEYTASEPALAPYHRGYIVPLSQTGLIAVTEEDISRVAQVLDSLSYDETIASLVESLSVPHLISDVTWLSGEAPESPIATRHSLHPQTRIAASWIAEQIESTGAVCELRSFIEEHTPNVICRYTGTDDTDAFIILSAHYDSRGPNINVQSPAPGANDDGSGTAAVLAVARAIASNSISFKSNVELVLFGGEEQGLLGSRAYSQELRATNANLTLLIQSDMVAYHRPGEPAQLGLPEDTATPEVVQLLANVSALYSPELTVGFTGGCCTDHQPFFEQGFPAASLFERAGPIADPEYHSVNDISNREGYDFEQLRSITKVKFATLLHTAGYNGT